MTEFRMVALPVALGSVRLVVAWLNQELWLGQPPTVP